MADCDQSSLDLRLTESEDKLNKFKALAVKLKKELLESKEQLSKSTSDVNDLRAQLAKCQDREKERISSSYQQLVRNFQSLQTEYDKLQDESDSLKKTSKQFEHDLTNALSELTSVREELAESKSDNDRQRNAISVLSEEKDAIEIKKREIESKVIVLQNDLESERKRNAANAGLELTIAELRNQLDIKTTEIVDLADKLECAKEQTLNFDNISRVNEELVLQLQCLKDDNSNYKETINELKDTLETKISDLEHYKLNSCDSTARIQFLENELKTSNESNQRLIKALESDICNLQSELSVTEDELTKKSEEYETYKLRVCRVLKQKQNGSNNFDDSKHKENLDTTIKNLTLDINDLKQKLETSIKDREILQNNYRQLNNSHNLLKNELNESENLKIRLEECKSENEKLKSLAREIQSTIVNERLESEKFYKSKMSEIEKSHATVLSDLQRELQEVNNELNSLRIENEKISVQSNGIDLLNKSRQSLNTLDELESVETTSIQNKRLSISSNSMGGNLLEEILNSDSHEYKPAQDFTIHLTLTQNKVENLTQLLEESESSNSLLTEQNRVLKEEIRRLQRIVDRLEMAENLEYLKNIIVKFITLSGGDERQQLIPVLATILKLSREEQHLFQSVASNDHNLSNNSRWTDYLYQWSASNK